MRLTQAALTLTLALAPRVALAFDSHCYVRSATDLEPAGYSEGEESNECPPGPMAARHRWVGTLDEHRQFLTEAFARVGLPDALLRTQRLRVYTPAASYPVGAATIQTLRPAWPWNTVEVAATRNISLGELAQLPDFSFALWDWASGNEQCPIDVPLGTGWDQCHTFGSHMGPVNSNHFLPQAQAFYRYYHRLALARAHTCRDLRDALRATAPRFDDVPRQCEIEALAIESVGQHFLEDAWSMGHMWERWGSPDLDDFPGATSEDRRARASLVAAAAGIIHGANAIVQPFFNRFRPGLRADDPMCSPFDPAGYAPGVDPLLLRSGGARFVSSGGTSLYAGLGDRYKDRIVEELFATQRATLASCGAAGVAEVYAASGAIHGAPSGAADPSAPDPTSDACMGQRATNASIFVGMGITFRNASGTYRLIPMNGTVIASIVSIGSRLLFSTPVTSTLWNQFRREIARVAEESRIWADTQPGGQQLANGAFGDFLGVRINSGYPRDGLTPPARYSDPPLPWPGEVSRTTEEASRARALAGLFHRAHAADWCAAMRVRDLEALRDHVSDTVPDSDARAAACEACGEFAARHLRVGRDASAYDTNAEPLCHHLLLPTERTADRYVYQPGRDHGDVSALARTWCGCEQNWVLTDTGLARVSLAGESARRLPVAGVADGVVRAGEFPRAVAMTSRDGLRAIVPNNNGGTLSVLSLDPGREREIDQDFDPSTTTPGAPAGVTRLTLGRTPHGVAVTPDGRYALVTVGGTDEVVVYDLDGYRVCKRFTVGPDTTPGNDDPYDVVITRDGRKGYVSLHGTTGVSPGRFVAVLDMARVLDCASVGSEVRRNIVTTTSTSAVMYPTALALSPDEARLAVVGTTSDTVLLIDTATEAIVPVSSDSRRRDLSSPRSLTSVAWWPNGAALYMGSVLGPADTSLSANGVVRYGQVADGATTYAVGVRSAVRCLTPNEDGSVVYVGDATGNLTALARRYWLGVPPYYIAPFDGTGGCIETLSLSHPTVPCDAALNFGGGAALRQILRY